MMKNPPSYFLFVALLILALFFFDSDISFWKGILAWLYILIFFFWIYKTGNEAKKEKKTDEELLKELVEQSKKSSIKRSAPKHYNRPEQKSIFSEINTGRKTPLSQNRIDGYAECECEHFLLYGECECER